MAVGYILTYLIICAYTSRITSLLKSRCIMYMSGCECGIYAFLDITATNFFSPLFFNQICKYHIISFILFFIDIILPFYSNVSDIVCIYVLCSIHVLFLYVFYVVCYML